MRKAFSDFCLTEKEHVAEDMKLLLCLGAAVFLLHITGIGCPILFLTGIPCAGCGMCRAVFFLFQGQFAAAAAYHPLSFLMPFFSAAWFFRGRISSRWRKILMTFAVFLFTVTYFFRIALGDPVVALHPSAGLLEQFIKEVIHVLYQLRR